MLCYSSLIIVVFAKVNMFELLVVSCLQLLHVVTVLQYLCVCNCPVTVLFRSLSFSPFFLLRANCLSSGSFDIFLQKHADDVMSKLPPYYRHNYLVSE